MASEDDKRSNDEFDSDGGEASGEEVAPAKRKRGRPAKLNKVVKVPSGRGRGRPPKDGSSPAVKKTPVKVAAGRVERTTTPRSAKKDAAVGSPNKLRVAATATIADDEKKGRGRPKK